MNDSVFNAHKLIQKRPKNAQPPLYHFGHIQSNNSTEANQTGAKQAHQNRIKAGKICIEYKSYKSVRYQSMKLVEWNRK